MSPLKNNDGFTFVEVLLIVLILAFIGTAGYMAFQRIGTVPKPSASSQATLAPSELKVATFSGDRLKLKYPAGWKASTDSVTGGLLIEKPSGDGKFVIRLESAADGLIANASSNAGYKPVTSFTFNGASAYIISDSVSGEYLLSSCSAPNLCFFSPKYDTKYKGISEDLTYFKPGQQMENTLPNDPASLAEARQIMATLSY
ncbi:MAG TPA: hypothetical protein VJP80_03845 [Candidatus Saccharimonadales bacterium]|nr:hypothetical protein [Candidatus Saccharimonadales bacterium]